MKRFLDWLLNRWEYGHLPSGMPARRACRTGRVEFQIWAPGEHGHPNGFWALAGKPDTFRKDPEP